jgi:oligopeptide transport system permease protein
VIAGLLGLWCLTLVLQFFAIDFPMALWWLDAALTVLGLGIYTVRQGLTLYVTKRIFEALFTLWIIASLTFVLLRVMPGGPFDSDKALPPEVKANIEARYHLNAPVWQQYGEYLTGLVHGDLGESYKYIGRSVSDIIAETLPVSAALGMYSLVLSFLFGIPLGVYAAARHNTWLDNTLMILAISGVSLPSFLIAPILILIFCFGLGWFEPALWTGPTTYVLPVVVLATRSIAVIARLTRASVLDVIRSDYVRTARSKGLSDTTVLFRHVLKNSMIPVLTFSGPLVAEVLSGSFIVELIFAIPGIGKHTVLAVSNRDYPLVLATTLVFSVLLVFANLVVDILYAYLDPRIQLS